MDKITLFTGKQESTMKYHWIPNTFSLLVSRVDLDKTEVVVIDERIEKENTIKLLEKHVPSSIFLGISSSTGFHLGRAIETAEYVKSRFPQIPIVWGGAHVTALIEESLKEDFVDVVVAGRGDDYFPRLIEGMKNKNLNGIPGIYWDKDGSITGSPNEGFSDLNLTPAWPYKILKIEDYINPKTKAINMTTSWGCPNLCTFCYWYKNNNPWSGFSPERVFSEARNFIEEYGIKKFYFLEADYFGDVGRALNIARLIKDLNISYITNARVSDVGPLSKEDFKLLEESGCSLVNIGLESASPKMLKLMNKRINLDDVLVGVKNAKNTNILLFFTLLFQMPGEDIDDVKVTYQYVEKLRELNPNIRIQNHFFCPLPNLPMTRLATKKGYSPPDNMKGWVKETQWIDGFEMRPWMAEQFKRGYGKLFEELFPSDDSTSEAYNK